VTSRMEYLRNKQPKQTSILSLKPEPSRMVDKRMAESDFHMTSELLKGMNVASDAKAMRLNRRQMQKNAPL